jgi:hypothetical protein
LNYNENSDEIHHHEINLANHWTPPCIVVSYVHQLSDLAPWHCRINTVPDIFQREVLSHEVGGTEGVRPEGFTLKIVIFHGH